MLLAMLAYWGSLHATGKLLSARREILIEKLAGAASN
jgi:hypothetical protein